MARELVSELMWGLPLISVRSVALLLLLAAAVALVLVALLAVALHVRVARAHRAATIQFAPYAPPAAAVRWAYDRAAHPDTAAPTSKENLAR